MPIIRTIRAFATETVEIQWTKKVAEGEYETLVERHACPPPATWAARAPIALPPGVPLTSAPDPLMQTGLTAAVSISQLTVKDAALP